MIVDITGGQTKRGSGVKGGIFQQQKRLKAVLMMFKMTEEFSKFPFFFNLGNFKNSQKNDYFTQNVPIFEFYLIKYHKI